MNQKEPNDHDQAIADLNQIALEESVIGCTMLFENEQFPPGLLDVEPEHFVDKNRSAIWMAIQSLVSENATVDEITVARRCEEYKSFQQFPYLSELVNRTPSSGSLEHWVQILVDVGEQRLSHQRVQAIIANGGDPLDIATQIEQVAKDQKKRFGADGLIHVGQVVQGVIQDLQKEYENPNEVVLVKTGIPKIDKVLRMSPSELTVVAGRPGMGKTAFAGNIASHVARNPASDPVALFSLEMPARALVRRMIAADSGLDSRKLLGHLGSRALSESCDNIHRLNLFVDARPRLDVLEMRRELLRLGRVSLIIVDYVQLAKLDTKLPRHDLQISRVIQDLHDIGKDFHCHVIALSQLNRELEKRPKELRAPRMSDLRDSGGIEETANNIILLHRPYVYDEDEDPCGVQIIIPKQRDGETCCVEISWNPRTQRFHE